MHPDPVTWSTQERAARYREQAAQFVEMASSAGLSPARDRLLELARHYDQLAESLEKHQHAAG
jgi:hypothetical protein